MIFKIQLLVLILSLSDSAFADTQPLPSQNLTDDQAIQILNQNREDLQKQIAPFNSINPMSDQQTLLNGGTPAQLPKNLQMLQGFLENKWFKKYMKAITDKEIVAMIPIIAKHPNRTKLLYFEIGFVFLMFIFRSWRLFKAYGLTGRLWVRFYCFVLFVGIGSFLIPHLVIGPVYFQFTKRFFILMTQ